VGRQRNSEPPPSVPGAVWVPLTKERFALVDAEVADTVLAKSWSVSTSKGGAVYAESRIRLENGKHGTSKLHHFVAPLLGLNKFDRISFVNGDTTDCRRQNMKPLLTRRTVAPYTIYGIRDGAGAIRYVGSTSKHIEVRLRGHLDQARRGVVTQWLTWLATEVAAGHSVTVEALGYAETEDEAHTLEARAIDDYKAAGAPLLNNRDPVTNLHSEASRARMSVARI
jgi:hypothetical protein